MTRRHPPLRPVACRRLALEAVAVLVVVSSFVSCSRSTDDWVADLRNDDEYRRLLAAIALRTAPRSQHDADLVAELICVLPDTEDDVTDAARETLTQLAVEIPEAFQHVMGYSTVVRAPGSPPPTFVRNSAAHFLAVTGAIDTLIATLQDEASIGRTLAAQGLGQIGLTAAKPLVSLLETTTDPAVRNLAAVALGRALTSNADAARALLGEISASSARDAVLDILRQANGSAPPDEITIHWVVDRLNQWRGDDPIAAIQAEIDLRLAGPPVAKFLVELLDHRDFTIAKNSAGFLLSGGPKGLQAAFPLLDPDHKLHRAVLERMGQSIGDPTPLIALLLPIAQRGEPRAARRALVTLGGLHAKGTPALDELRKLRASKATDSTSTDLRDELDATIQKIESAAAGPKRD